jgi:diaminopimelate epimerase
MQASGKDHAVMESRAGLLVASRAGERLVSVDMGKPGLAWTDIPLTREQDTRALDVKLSDDPALGTAPGCVSMGNPHVVFFVDDLDAAPVTTAGPAIEHHPLFPQAVNVGFAQVIDRDRIRLRVWERGAGLTKACGTGACAAVVAAARRDLTDRSAVVVTDGGELLIEWRAEDDHVIMTGPAAVDFAGELP